MPVRFLNSSVLKWPSRDEVLEAVKKWAEELKKDANILKIGVFGSLAEGSWGVGSDIDIVVVVKESEKPFWRRPLDFDKTSLPVSADILVYTEKEWESIKNRRFGKTLREKALWL